MIPSTKNRCLGNTLLALCLVLPSASHALQVLEAKEGETLFARISTEELTRLAIEGGRIRSWHVPSGRLVIDKDAVEGQLFIRPMEGGKPISIFLVSDSGSTYALTLQPADIPAESLVIKEQKARAARPSAAERASSRQEMIKALLIEAASGRIPDDMEIKELGEDVRLWRGTRFTHDRDWLGLTVAIGHYRLLNTSQTDIRIAEQEFFRPDVIAVAAEKHLLRPGESTRVFIVRQREEGRP